MALSATPNCSQDPLLSPQPQDPNPNKKKWKKKKKKSKKNLAESQGNLDDINQQQQQLQVLQSSTPSRKRNTSPGVRIRGGRIFDSENGKTCHQCRQKTMDLVALCKGLRGDKRCTFMFCHKCLLNRYGENAEEANHLDDWDCPKCRGICNCSFCMKKKGHQPTGILAHTAKATGFGSVMEMLTVKGPENITGLRNWEGKRKSLEKSIIVDNALEGGKDNGTLRRKKIKGIHFISALDLNVTLKEEEMIFENVDGGEKVPNIRHNQLKKLARAKKNADVLDNGSKPKKKTKKAHISSETNLNVTLQEEEQINEMVKGVQKMLKIRQNKLKKLARAKGYVKALGNIAQLENSTPEPQIHKKTTLDPINREENISHSKDSQICIFKDKATMPIKKEEGTNEYLGDDQSIADCKYSAVPDPNVSLPLDYSLTPVSDIELPAEDVLQFLEFCNNFGEELLSKEVPGEQVSEPTPVVPLEILASWCNFVHMIS